MFGTQTKNWVEYKHYTTAMKKFLSSVPQTEYEPCTHGSISVIQSRTAELVFLFLPILRSTFHNITRQIHVRIVQAKEWDMPKEK